MKKELVVYRNLLTVYKAIKATYNDDYSPNQPVWRMANRVILNAQETLGVAVATKLQERAMIKAGIRPSEPVDYTNFDWNNPDNWAKSE